MGGNSSCSNVYHYLPWGTKVGQNSGVDAFLNCDRCYNGCSKNNYLEKGIIRDVNEPIYTGSKWQCVEYSRRWLLTVKQINFESLWFAKNIFTIENVYNYNTKSDVKFLSFPNGSQEPPIYGDLMIFPRNWGALAGHVAVVTGSNTEQGCVEIAEQNYDNRWENPESYARRLVMINLSGNFYVTEIKWNDSYFETNKGAVLESIMRSTKDDVIGWKRVNEQA